MKEIIHKIISKIGANSAGIAGLYKFPIPKPIKKGTQMIQVIPIVISSVLIAISSCTFLSL